MTVLPPRSGCRLAMLAFLAAGALFLPPVVLRYALPGLSPFLFVCAAVAARRVGLPALLSLPMLAFVVRRRRGFCHYFCPVGWVVEVCARTRASANCEYGRVPPIGHWVALLTIGGAVATLPLFLLVDPLALFTGAACGAHVPLSIPQLACAAGLAVVLVLSVAFPLLWCKRLCPLGATQELLAELNGLFARRVSGAPSAARESDLRLARRAFFGLGGGMAVSALAVRAPGVAASRLRPPGAVDDARFATLCVRCGNCVRSCPSRIIRPDVQPPSLTKLLAPTLSFEANYCLETCNACGQNCPTGAIAALSLGAKNACRIGLARIAETGCLLAVEKECSACAAICPRSAIFEEFSPETYTAMVRVDAQTCTGCGACVAVCPPRVISVAPLGLHGHAGESGDEDARLADRRPGMAALSEPTTG